MYVRAERARDNEVRARAQAQDATRRAEQAAEDARQAAEQEVAARAAADSARAEAERAGSDAQTIVGFLQNDLLRSAIRIKGREATVVDVLDAASKNLESKFKDQPSIEISLRETLGQVYYALGYYKDSAFHREHQYDLLLQHQGRTFYPKNWLAVAYWAAGNSEEAAKIFEGLIHEKISNGNQPQPWLKLNLAHQYERLHQYEKAKKIYDETFKAAWWDPNHPNHHLILLHAWVLAKIYKEQGRYEDSEGLFVKTLQAQRDMYGPTGDKSNRVMIRCMNEVARLYVIQGRYQEAEDLFLEGIELGGRELPGKDHPFTLRHVNGLAVLRTKQQRYKEAEALFNRALQGRKLKLGDDHPFTLETINDLGILHRQQKHYEQAEKLLTEALEKRKAKLGEDHPHTLQTIHELAVLYKEQGRYEEAEPLLIEAAEGRLLKLGDVHPHTIESISNLIDLYEAWNKPEKAEAWQLKLPK
jgi:tetratricopeptide (TPR) repeat protein